MFVCHKANPRKSGICFFLFVYVGGNKLATQNANVLAQGIGFAIPRANTFPFFCVKHKKHQIQRICAGNVEVQKTQKFKDLGLNCGNFKQ